MSELLPVYCWNSKDAKFGRSKRYSVQIINRETGLSVPIQTDAKGRFYRGLLAPGVYTIRVTMAGFQTREVYQRLFVQRTGDVIPVPVTLDPVGAAPSFVAGQAGVEETELTINRTDARRDGSYTERDVTTLPLGATTLVRSFDELALLLPGVAPPPQTIGNGTGPGQGAGVGSAGQFAVNGLRSRGNNFTVDGSDNNDEDIGVRRQGFLSLIPQPIESIKEYQVITLLAPAQFGRNIGAQVNALSKSGGNQTHGILYGMFNSSRLNARNPFNTNDSNSVTPLLAGNNQPVILRTVAYDPLTGSLSPNFSERPFNVRGPGKEPSTLGQGGFTIGGPLWLPRFGEGGPAIRKSSSMFYFISMEGQLLNATKKVDFAVPTVDQRGVGGSGATGLIRNPITGASFIGQSGLESRAFDIRKFTPYGLGREILSFFPFPNNPNGVYGANTLTQVLPADGKGGVISGRFDSSFRARGRQQSFTGRYNLTNDWRDIPATGGAIFSTLRPVTRTQNVSTFLNSEVSSANSTKPIFNQLRLSYGRTHLDFKEVRDTTFLLPSGRTRLETIGVPVGTPFEPLNSPFLLNAPLLFNDTVPAHTTMVVPPTLDPNSNICKTFPSTPGCGDLLTTITGPNTGPVIYTSLMLPTLVISPGTPPSRNFPGSPPFIERESPFPFLTTEELIGPVGQVNIAGFSPVGVDVLNFPQRRVNNTYQMADNLTWRFGSHSLAFGTDIRRTELNSDLPRNSRPLATFNGAPSPAGSLQPFLRPIDLAAAGAASGFSQSLVVPGGSSNINLRYYQLNFFGQDEWRIKPNLSLSYGMRYEYNTAPREINGRIENTFNSPLLGQVPNLRLFIEGRSRIFDPDKRNFAPRVSVAYSPDVFGRDRGTVIRGGYGLFYDQILGAVVSQSRNVYPTFITPNFGGGLGTEFGIARLGFINPRSSFSLVQANTLNTLNPGLTLRGILDQIARSFLGSYNGFVPENFLNFTLAARRLHTPMAQHYDLSIEQQLSPDLVISAAYIGTRGSDLLRFTTPNLGPNPYLVVDGFDVTAFGGFLGSAGPPGSRPDGVLVIGLNAITLFTGGRPVSGVGTVFRFETTAKSSYHALQLQARGRFHRSLQYQATYTLSNANDDVSDVFDLAGASALPQNSLTFAGEWGPANFDTRHRFTYNFIYDLPAVRHRSHIFGALFGGLQLAGTGQFQTGQPFTVNTIYDVNLDGNNTDRLNTTDGLIVTGDRHQPLRLAPGVDPFSLLAPTGQDGKVGRNTFRAGNILELDISVIKSIAISDRQKVSLRADVFNVINRANFGIPVRFLEAPGFGKATETVTPGRRIQFALKYSF